MQPCDIDPNRLYAFGEAAKMIPSCRGGHVALPTLRAWRLAGRFRAESRRSGKLCYWFVRGSELLRLLAGPVAMEIQSPAQRKRRHESNQATLRKYGVIK